MRRGVAAEPNPMLSLHMQGLYGREQKKERKAARKEASGEAAAE